MLKLLTLLVLGVVVAIVVAAVGLFAFGGNDSNAGGVATPKTELTATEVLQAATEKAANVTSFHFVLTHENGTTPLPLNLALVSAEGDVVVPASMHADVDARRRGSTCTCRSSAWITGPG